MSDNAAALAAITVDDLLYGIRDDGRSDLLLVLSADALGFLARNVTNHTTFRFGRHGEGVRDEDGRRCTIASIAKLPADLREIAIGLDRRLGMRPEYPATHLTEDEIRLMLTHAKFFEAHVLPGREELVQRARKLRAVSHVLLLEWDRSDVAENSPALDEYDEYLPALLALLASTDSASAVEAFLARMAISRDREEQVLGRGKAAAASLLRLRREWT